MCKFSPRFFTLTFIASLSFILDQTAKADSPFQYDSGEKEVFLDTFSGAAKGWDLGTDAEIKDGKWGPKAPNVPEGGVVSNLKLANPVALEGGPIAVYFSLSTNLVGGGDACKTTVGLEVQNSNRFVSLCVIPRKGVTQFDLGARDAAGKAIAGVVASHDDWAFFKNAGNPINFRFVVRKMPDGTISLQPAVWDGSHWQPLDSVTSSAESDTFDLGKGPFDKIIVSTRNFTATGEDPRSYLSAVAITQIQQK
jgi:hypothetical protein